MNSHEKTQKAQHKKNLRALCVLCIHNGSETPQRPSPAPVGAGLGSEGRPAPSGGGVRGGSNEMNSHEKTQKAQHKKNLRALCVLCV